MEEKELEIAFEKLKQEIPINEVLKGNLRQSFTQTTKRRGGKLKYFLAASAAVAAVVLALNIFLPPHKAVQIASAASLKIFNQVSFVEIGGGQSLGVSEYKGKVFVPVADKGVFTYDQKGFEKILAKPVDFVRISPDGKKLVYSAEGSIGLYDLTNKKVTQLLQGDGNQITYLQPAWSADGQKILYNQATITMADPNSHGFTQLNHVYQLDLATGQKKQLAEGAYPNFVFGRQAIIFERENKVILKDLTNNQEQVIDNGRFPAVSPDGNYVVYVKNETKETALPKNAKVVENLDNVWIADTGKAFTKRRVTTNFTRQYIKPEDWLKTIKPLDIPQVLNFSGNYSYYDPVWSSDSNSILVLKNVNAEGGGGLRINKIDFTEQKLSSEYTVKKFLQALVLRDDDFAKSLMQNPPGILTTSNPHPVGYRIIKSGQAGEKDFVDVEIMSAYTANPDFSISKARFYLSRNKDGFIIDSVKFNDGLLVSARDQEMYLMQGKEKQLLFTESDIPKQYLPQGKHRFASLAYSESTNNLFFTIQQQQDGAQKAAVILLSYNLKNKKFTLLSKVNNLDGYSNVGISNLIASTNGKYVAMDLFSDDEKDFNSHAQVYDVSKKQMMDLERLLVNTQVAAIATKYWDENKLVLSVLSNNQSMTYLYQPQQQQLISY